MKHKDKDDKSNVSEDIRDRNPDPVTDEKGSHPVGVAGGGATGGAAGAAIGAAVGGPAGAVVGGIVGAVAGGLAGKGIAEAVNPTEENEFWRNEYRNRPYYQSGTNYDTYEPYYRYGWEAATRPEFQGRSYEDIDDQLEREWPAFRGTPTSNFGEFRNATQDAYERARNSIDRKKHETSHRSDAFWNQVQGNWKQFKGTIKERFNRLTDDDIEAMEGRKEKIIGKIQERYGEAQYSAQDIENQLSEVYAEK